MAEINPQTTIIWEELTKGSHWEMEEAAVRLRLIALECFVKTTSIERVFMNPNEVEELMQRREGIANVLRKYERFRENLFYDPRLVSEIKGYLSKLQTQ